MTHAIKDHAAVITRPSTAVGEAMARLLARTATPQAPCGATAVDALPISRVGQPAATLNGRYARDADEPSHIHIPRPSRAARGALAGR